MLTTRCRAKRRGPKILLVPVTETAITEDTKALTLLTQESLLKHRSTGAICSLKESEGEAKRDCFALMLCRYVLLTKS